MRYSEITLLSALVASAAARPSLYSSPSARAHARDMKLKREVPQEQSHKKFLTKTQEMLLLDNPDQIVDSVFGLLGNAAASEGIGSIADADCLQQATADQAFTNAVAAGDVEGQVAALIYRTLERNTGSVGLASVDCTAIQATNPQIAALSQHQDPASDGAAQINKDIVLELAAQIAAVGGDPLEALQSGTFEPGDVNDATGAGNTCNDENDAEGCIFTENLLVEDASEAEILAAVEGIAANENADDATLDNVERGAARPEEIQLDRNNASKGIDNANAKRFKQQASRNIDFNNRNNLFADVNFFKQNIFNQQQFQQQIFAFQNFDAILIQQQFAQFFQQIQFQAWQQIAIQEFLLQQQLQQQLIQQQLFFQQQAFFQQQIVQNVALVFQQHIQILQQNVNIIQLGGFDFIQQQFVQQFGGLDSFAQLLNIGGGFNKFQNNVQLQKLFGGQVGAGFF